MNDKERAPDAEWARTTLGQILPLEYGKGLPERSRNIQGQVPVMGSSGIVGHHDQPYCSLPALIVGRKGNVGAVYHSSVPCWPIDTVYFCEGTLSTNLAFFHHLLSFLDLRRLDKSTAVPGLSRGDYSAVEVTIPPLPEQHRIVEAIESYITRLDDAVATLERVRRNLKRYRASVLKAAVEGRLAPAEADLPRGKGRNCEPALVFLDHILTARRRLWEDAGGRGKYKEPVAPNAADLPMLPEGWCWATLDQLTILVTSGSRGWAKFYSGSGPIFIRAQDIKTDVLNTHNAAHVSSPGGAEGTRTRVQLGDLLVTITGANVTKTAFVASDIGEAYVSQHVGLCRPVLPEIVRYLHTFLICPSAGRRQLELAAYGAGKPGLNLDNLKELRVAFPPAADQERIVVEADRYLSVADEVEKAVERNLRRADRLRQSILRWAFVGRLANQDPSDEPASGLLARVKAEREASRDAERNGRMNGRARKTT